MLLPRGERCGQLARSNASAALSRKLHPVIARRGSRAFFASNGTVRAARHRANLRPWGSVTARCGASWPPRKRARGLPAADYGGRFMLAFFVLLALATAVSQWLVFVDGWWPPAGV